MPKLTRRTFIKITGVSAASVAAATGTRALLEHGGAVERPTTTVLAAASLDEKWVRTTCALCPSGCGLEVRVVGGRAVKVEGNPLHPLNQGVCCLRGQTALEVLYSPERIRHPLIRTTPKTFEVSETSKVSPFREASWEEALALVAGKLREVRGAGQAHTVGFLHGETRGSLRELIGRFMVAYGSPNVISHAPAAESVARQAMYLSQGINGLPIYDLNNAKYALAFGGNLLETSRHVIGALAATAFMRRGRPQRGKLVAISPRLGLTGVKADEWVPIRPGTYGALVLGMANVIISSGLHDKEFVRDYTFGFEDFVDERGGSHKGFKSLVLEQYTLARVEMMTGVPTADIARLAGEFATNRPAVAILPTEADGLDGAGVYAALAIHSLNALVGAIDTAGGVLVQRFPKLADWPAYTDDQGLGIRESGVDLVVPNPQSPIPNSQSLQALFILNANPVYDRPDGGEWAQALRQTPFVVSFASTLDETAAHADVILPASTFLEIWGDDFVEGAGYPGVSLRRPVVEPVYDTRNPGDVLLQLAKALGGSVAQALPWPDYRALMDYRLAAIDMDRAKFDENGVWSELVYFNAQPGSRAWADVVGRDRVNAPRDGRFDFFSRELFASVGDPLRSPTTGQGQAIAPTDLACLPHFDLPAASTAEAGTFPFLLVTQELITEPQGWWGIVPTLQESYGLQTNRKWTSWVEVSPRAAESLLVKNDDLVWVESPTGKVQVPIRIYAGLWPNAVYLPPGQGHRTQVKWGRDSATDVIIGANVNQLRVGDGVTRVRIQKA
ncbi:MAG: molybdopterin-dependent oxidoreductase [Chloroflexi bacterium]|nr:molybdopterin-dependent oxidoreductase [Chloroflexota bacterium]